MAVSDYSELIERYGFLYNVPLDWIRAIMEAESNGNPNVHPVGDGYGLMQVLLSTARGLGYSGSPEGLYDPETNIRLGVQLIADLIERYGWNLNRVYSAYNSGDPDAWETRSDVRAHLQRVLDILPKYAGFSLVGLGLLLLIVMRFKR